jgi:two-component system CheB/CheR fusion protein
VTRRAKSRGRPGDDDGHGDGHGDGANKPGGAEDAGDLEVAADKGAAAVAPPPPPEFAPLLNYLKRARGFDFTNYKPTGLARRFQKRMELLGIDGYSHYMDFLEVHPEEFEHLFNTILINVTGFFRDPGAWDYVASTIVPNVLSQKSDGQPIRCWSAACASGEEAYTLAMILTEAMGREPFEERVKIYATDVDEQALNQARMGSYSAGDVASIPPPLVEKYFEPVSGRYVFDKDLRRCVIFGRHDLFEDAPISRVDLLVCRNALMYFNAEAQARILTRFHFALNEGGYLFLGKAEMLLTHGDLFTPIDLRRRVFTKVTRGTLRERLLSLAQGQENGLPLPESPEELRSAAFDAGPVAQLVTDAAGHVMAINERARDLFGLTERDVGRPVQDLAISYKPADLRLMLEQALREQRPIASREIQWSAGPAERMYLDLAVTPLPEAGKLLGVLITYTDVTRHKRIGEELRHAHESLQASQEELQSTTEELETTNEELQSTVEELETTNEELQSTNEELETMNEELQSTNEELHTINDELRQRSEELNTVNAFLESILTSMRKAVVVVDNDLRVKAWNDQAEEMWGLRSDEVRGQHFSNLDIGLPVDKVRPILAECIAGESQNREVVLTAVNRRGRTIQCHVSCSQLVETGAGTRGAILLLDEVEKQDGVG